jgi:hypothetical protein
MNVGTKESTGLIIVPLLVPFIPLQRYMAKAI